MRTHSQIIADAGGYRALAERLGMAQERVRFWERRGSIPLDAWPEVAEAGVASQDELRDAAVSAARDKVRSRPQDEAAA